MGKKSKPKTWLVKFRQLPTIEVVARTEGSAKTQVFQFLIKEKILLPGMNRAFHNEARVGILKTVPHPNNPNDNTEQPLTPIKGSFTYDHDQNY